MIDWNQAVGQINQGLTSATAGVGAARQPYAAPQQQTTPASPSDNVSTQLADTMAGLGVQTWGGVGSKFAEDVLAMEAAGRPNTGKITLPPGVGPQDLMTLLSEGEAFASSAGWRYAPTAQMYNQMMQQGLFRADQSAVFQWLAQVNGVADKMPWAAAGLTHTQYQNQKESIADTIGEYAGDRNAFGDLQQQAMTNRWSTQHVIQELTNNPSYAAKSPWLKYGMTYQAFKDFKRQNQTLAKQQFGFQPSDEQFATMYGQDSKSTPQSGSAVNLQQSGQNALVTTGAKSQVR